MEVARGRVGFPEYLAESVFLQGHLDSTYFFERFWQKQNDMPLRMPTLKHLYQAGIS